jgi:hypothetical protein
MMISPTWNDDAVADLGDSWECTTFRPPPGLEALGAKPFLVPSALPFDLSLELELDMRSEKSLDGDNKSEQGALSSDCSTADTAESQSPTGAEQEHCIKPSQIKACAPGLASLQPSAIPACYSNFGLSVDFEQESDTHISSHAFGACQKEISWQQAMCIPTSVPAPMPKPKPAARWLALWCDEAAFKERGRCMRRELEALGARVRAYKAVDTFVRALEGGGHGLPTGIPCVLFATWRTHAAIELLGYVQSSGKPGATVDPIGIELAAPFELSIIPESSVKPMAPSPPAS